MLVAGLSICFGNGPVRFINVLILPGFWIVVFLLAMLLKLTPAIVFGLIPFLFIDIDFF